MGRKGGWAASLGPLPERGARIFLAVRPQEFVRFLRRSRRQLRARTAGPRSWLVERDIGEDVEAISNAPITYLALVQVPPRAGCGVGVGTILMSKS